MIRSTIGFSKIGDSDTDSLHIAQDGNGVPINLQTEARSISLESIQGVVKSSQPAFLHFGFYTVGDSGASFFPLFVIQCSNVTGSFFASDISNGRHVRASDEFADEEKDMTTDYFSICMKKGLPDSSFVGLACKCLDVSGNYQNLVYGAFASITLDFVIGVFYPKSLDSAVVNSIIPANSDIRSGWELVSNELRVNPWFTSVVIEAALEITKGNYSLLVTSSGIFLELSGGSVMEVSSLSTTFNYPIFVPISTAADPAIEFPNGSGFYESSGIGTSISGTLKFLVGATRIECFVPILCVSGTAAAPSILMPNTTGLFESSGLGVAVGGVRKLLVGSTLITNDVPMLFPAGTSGAPSILLPNTTGLYESSGLGVSVGGTSKALFSSTELASEVPVSVPAGTAASPSILLPNTTGLYESSGVGISVGGVRKILVSSTEITADVPIDIEDVGSISKSTTYMRFDSTGGFWLQGTNGAVNLYPGDNRVNVYRANSAAAAIAFTVKSNVTVVGQEHCNIYCDGDLENTNGSYGAISDERLKADVSYARGYLDDLCSIRVRKYRNLVSGIDNIGVIAQEIESIFPSLVSIRDEETGMRSVKMSIFIPMLITAVQELRDMAQQNQESIIALENSHAALSDVVSNLVSEIAILKALH
jgi:hypothetical protein